MWPHNEKWNPEQNERKWEGSNSKTQLCFALHNDILLISRWKYREDNKRRRKKLKSFLWQDKNQPPPSFVKSGQEKSIVDWSDKRLAEQQKEGATKGKENENKGLKSKTKR